MNICIFGDSIVWGASDYERGGWAERLKVHCMEKYDDVTVYNLGISGDNTESLLKRLEKEAADRDPDLIIFAIGTNDAQYVNEKGSYGVGMDRFRDNLSMLVDGAGKLSSEIAFIGLTEVDESKTAPIPWDPEKYHDNESVHEYNEAIGSLCERHGARYIDMKGVIGKNDLEDGLHPNSRGHDKIFQKVLKELEAFLRDENWVR